MRKYQYSKSAENNKPMKTDKIDNPIYHADCFAFQNSGAHPGCSALIEMDCINCKFYKTKRQVEEEKARTDKRLAGLGMSDIPKEYKRRSYRGGKR